MEFEEILPILKKNPHAFAWRTDDPRWNIFAMRVVDNKLLEFEIREPEECRYIDLHSDDILSDKWEVSYG